MDGLGLKLQQVIQAVEVAYFSVDTKIFMYANTRMSQEDRILLHLIVSGKINNKECNEIYGFRHLPSVIRYLRKRNIKIVSEQRNGESRFGGRVYWVDYVLAPPKEQTDSVNIMIGNLKDKYKIA